MKELEHNGQSIPKGKRFCTCCGEIKRETAFDGASTHCKACCEKMLRTRPHVSGFLLCLLLIGAAAFAATLIPRGMSVDALVRKAHAFEDARALYTACDTYGEAVELARAGDSALFFKKADDEESSPAPHFFTLGKRTWRAYCRAYARAYTRTEAAEFAAAHLDKTQIDATQPMASYAQASREYNAVMAQVQKIQSEYTYSTPEEMPYDKIVEVLDKYVEAHDTANIRGYAAYFKGSAAWFHDPAQFETALKYYDEMLENVPDEYVSAYTGIAQIGLDGEQPDVLLRAAEGILSKNKEHGDAWSWKAQAQFDKGDIDAAQETAQAMSKICPDSPLSSMLTIRVALRQDDLPTASAARDEAAAAYDTKADEIFQSLLSKRTIEQAPERFLRAYVQYSLYAAAVSLLEGDIDTARMYGYERAFNYAYYFASITDDAGLMFQSVFNVAALTASLAEDEDALRTIVEISDCDDATRDVINGKISLQDAFCKGKAVIL